MGCGCGGAKKTHEYQVTKRDGTKVTVPTLPEAQAIVKNLGGAYKAVPVKA